MTVIFDADLRPLMERYVTRADCEILQSTPEGEALSVVVAKKTATALERKTENCMVCGASLHYSAAPAELICVYCGRKDSGYVWCPAGHYVCEACHGQEAYEVIRGIALSTPLRDPLAIAEVMMSHPSVPMLGCEHAVAAAAALMAALKNRPLPAVGEAQIVEAMERTQKQAISAYCGLTGVCGVPIAVGAVFSIVLGAACPKDRETAITMRAVGRVVDAVANDTGPCCCKSFVRTAMVVSYDLLKEYLNLKLPLHVERISCTYVQRHPHGCRASRCVYFPKLLPQPGAAQN